MNGIVAGFFIVVISIACIALVYTFSYGDQYTEVTELRGRHMDSGKLQGCELIVETGEMLCP